MITTAVELMDALDDQLIGGASEEIGFHFEGRRLEIENIEHVGDGSPIEITLKEAVDW